MSRTAKVLTLIALNAASWALVYGIAYLVGRLL